MNNSKNNNNLNKTTTLKTLLMLSIISMMLIPGGIILVHAVSDDQLLTINNPTPTLDNILEDITPPVLSVPTDVIANATGNTTIVSIGTASATDDVDSYPAIINDAPTTFPLGDTIITWTATDASGNLANAIQIITIRDTIPSTVTTLIDPNRINTEATTTGLVGGIVGTFAGERPFITTWSISELDKFLEIPTTGIGYNYTINWGDGTIDTAQTSNSIHTYVSAETYTVSISGDFPRIYLLNSDSAEKLISIDQWGDIKWISMNHAFHDASNMNLIATDVPDLSIVTDMSHMFRLASSFNGDISGWDTSNVIKMDWIFNDANSFNSDISNWDVSSVTDMYAMFFGANSFNSDISNWDVSNVTNMALMFDSADSFNSDVSNWDVSNVTNMGWVFGGADSFNSDVSNWDVSNVTNMALMFFSADSFNSDVSNWDVSSVTNMGWVFGGADSFNSDVSNWDVSNVTNMALMFLQANSFNGDVSNWDTSNSTSMSWMFHGADSFNSDISNWDVSSVTSMSLMLTDTSFSTNNYDKLLDKWSKLPTLQNNVNFDISSQYCNAGEMGRNIMTDTYGWIISDEGRDTIENCNNIQPPPEELFCGQPESYYNAINGTESSDYLVGTNSPDLIFGNGGNDMINTRGDNNCIYAGDGDDFVLAINDGNTVYGGAGNDSIMLKGTGIAYAEDGDDTTYIILPSVGHLLDGGDGSDLCVANARQQINTVNCELVKP